VDFLWQNDATRQLALFYMSGNTGAGLKDARAVGSAAAGWRAIGR
jgi:hypothetical protein